MTPQRAASRKDDDLLAERVDAFVARFGRLKDSLADKLLPALLGWLAEPLGTAIDNLARAERLGWVESLDDWLEIRRQRNRMIHDYIGDSAELAAVLTLARDTVPMLRRAASAMAARVPSTPSAGEPG